MSARMHTSRRPSTLLTPMALSLLAAAIATGVGCADSPRSGPMMYSSSLGSGDAMGLYMSRAYEQQARQISLARRQQLEQHRNGYRDETFATVPAPADGQ